MKLGIMQPYFFPYLGYFDLINYSDEWIVFDTVQYIRKGWMNRNRVLHPSTGWQYITVPVQKHSRETVIKDIEVHPNWQDKILAQLQHYKKAAPFFTETHDLIRECLEIKEPLLSRLNTQILEKVCKYVGISFNYKYFSEMDLEIGEVSGPGDWALRITEALRASEYVNPPGGESLFNPLTFKEIGSRLVIRKIDPIIYKPKGYEFVSGLSIIDVLMWCSPGEVKQFLELQREL